MAAVGLAAPAAEAYDAVIAWSPVAGVAGYRLYMRAGTAPFGAGVDLGARQADADGAVRAVQSGLAAGVSYGFVVTSYDAAAVESDFSNELSVSVPATPTPTPTASTVPSAAASTSTPTRTAVPATATNTRTATRTAPPPTSTPSATPTPTVTLFLDPIASPVLVGAANTLTGVGFSAGSVVVLFVATGSGAQTFGPYSPSSITPRSLAWNAPATIPLGDGFVSVVVVNTDQEYVTSNAQAQLLFGAPGSGLPTITAVNGLALNTVDARVPLASVSTALVPGGTLTIGGTGFANPVVSLFSSDPGSAVLEPLPGWTSTALTVALPASLPTGPGAIRVVNRPSYALSNLVSAPLGERIRVDGVSQSGSTITVRGAGFSVRTVINFFNAGPTGAANLGGMANGAAAIPFTLASSQQLSFPIPAAAASGWSYVQLLNPPFIPYTSTGNDPDGSFYLTVAPN